MNTTEPLEEFSKGTTPRYAVPFWTAAKTSVMVGTGFREYAGIRGVCAMVDEGKEDGEVDGGGGGGGPVDMASRVACVVLGLVGFEVRQEYGVGG